MTRFRTICTSLMVVSVATASVAASVMKRDSENKEKSEQVNQNTLRQVSVLMRHGERAPVDTYPKDPYINNSMSPFGWGQLSKKGRKNIWTLGTDLRKRYNDYLGDTYKPDMYWLQTSSADRTKMTGSILSSAIWQPNEQQQFNDQIKWQPVASHYWTRPEDKLLIIWNACPKLTLERMKLETSEEVKSINQKNQQLYNELAENTGNKFSSPGDVADLYATLKSEASMDLELPEWTKEYYPDKLSPLERYSLGMNVGNDLLKKLAGGPFVKKALQKMQDKAAGNLKPESRKMFVYVAHDSTIVNVMSAMGVWDGREPDYSAMLIIELHEDNGAWNVQVFQRSSVNDPFESLIIPGCDKACPLEEFAKLMKPILPDDYTVECQVDDPNYVIPAAPPA